MKDPQLRTFAVRSAGQTVVVHSEGRAVHHDLLVAAGIPHRAPVPAAPVAPALQRAGAPDVEIWVRRGGRAFDGATHTLVARGVRANPETGVVINSAGGSGPTQWWSAGDRLRVCFRLGPGPPALGDVVLNARHRGVDPQILVHYPTLWWAGVRGLAPLHAAVVALDDVVVMLAGPAGLGKTKLLSTAVRDGNPAMCQNTVVSDGTCTHGLAEPIRLASSRASPGRPGGGRAHWAAARTDREHSWHDRPPVLVPDVVVTVRRGDVDRESVRSVPPTTAARSLVAGTFAAGDLGRYWSLCAILALATGLGPPAPPVADVARKLTERVPCLELTLGPRSDPSLHELLSRPLAEIRRARPV